MLEKETIEKQSSIHIKGIREGLLVSLDEGDWQVILEALLNQIEQSAGFFQGARMALEVGNRVLHASELGLLRDRLGDRNVTLWAVISQSPVTEQTAQMLGLATRISTPRPERTVRSLDTNLEGENAVLVQRTLRSGFKLASKGHVIVIGDVNPGAEIEAGGSVVVWGRMRGGVVAGVEGGEESVVCALELSPTKLRIANVDYGVEQRTTRGPEFAKLKDGQVIIDAWVIKK